MSLTTADRQDSHSGVGKYFIVAFTTVLDRSLMLTISHFLAIFDKLLPCTVRQSFLLMLTNSRMAGLMHVSRDLSKFTKRLLKKTIGCIESDMSSMRYLCVCGWTLKQSRIAMFQLEYSLLHSFEKREYRSL